MRRSRQAILPVVVLGLLHLQFGRVQSQTQTPNRSQSVVSSPALNQSQSAASIPQVQTEANPSRRPKPAPDRKTREAFDEALLMIQRNYVHGDRLKYDELFTRSITGMLRSLDPHSNFYNQKDFEEQKAEWARSEYYGIGATIGNRRLRVNELDTFVLSTFENSPAARAGLRFGDRILEVDGQSMLGKVTSEVRDRLRGPSGTTVRVTLERAANGTRETVVIKREPVSQPTIPDAYMLEPAVGYIDMSRGFNRSTSLELITAIEKLKSQGITSLVLDLRNNGGGLLLEAVKVAERFLSKNQTIAAHVGTGPETAVSRRYVSANPSPETLPLVVLVNRSSASAAEILAGALQDHDRAVIVGERTFGKALVQTIYGLDYGTGLTLTTSRYYTPSGRSLQRDYSQTGFYDYIFEGGIGSRGADQDASMPKGPASRTASGRLVYGGAITPDQVGFVKPRMITPLQSRLFDPIFGFARDLINGRVSAQAFDAKQFHIDGPPNLKHDLQPGELNVDDRLFKAFKDYVANSGQIYKFTDNQLDREQEFIKRQLRFELVTAAYGVVKAARVLIADDPQILKALQVLPVARDLAATTHNGRSPLP